MHPEEILYRMKEAIAKYLEREEMHLVLKDSLDRLIFSEMFFMKEESESINKKRKDKYLNNYK